MCLVFFLNLFLLFELCSWFFEPGLQPQESAPLFFTRTKSDAVYVCGLSVGHSYLSMVVFILFYRNHSYRWAAVVPQSNWRSWALRRKTHAQDQFRYWVSPSMGLFKYLHVHHTASHVYIKKTKTKNRWTIGRSGERGSGISIPASRHDDGECVCLTNWSRSHQGFYLSPAMYVNS